MSPQAPGPTTVASVPAGHPYVSAAIARPGVVEDGVLVLPDVIPEGRPPEQWWPPVALDPDTLAGWLAADPDPTARTRPDLLHVQFGFEGVALADLRACVELLRDRRVPLVLTVHDLRNPHVEDDEDYAPRLDLLVRAADAVVTLTEAAADEVRRRWGRDAVVIPHPHVAPLDRIDDFAAHVPEGSLRVGLSLKSLRANTLRAAQVHEVARAVTGAGAHLTVTAHHEVMDAGFARYDPDMAAVLATLGQEADGPVDVVLRSRLDDDAFLADLARYDAVVLPYRFGTHSGVLEACRDVHTVAIVPELGCYTSQAPCPTYRPDDIAGTLPTALAAAADVLRNPSSAAAPLADGSIPTWAVDRAGREQQARHVREAHRRVYAAVIDADPHRGKQ